MEYEDDYHPETVHFSTKDAPPLKYFLKKTPLKYLLKKTPLKYLLKKNTFEIFAKKTHKKAK